MGTGPVITHRPPRPDVPSTEDGYRAAREAVGLVDRSAVGRLRLTGADALDLLDRLSTNHLQDLVPGHGLYTVLTTNKGRIVDLLFVLALETHLLVLTGPGTTLKVAEWIDFYTFTEDVLVEDVSGEAAVLSLVGPNADALLGDACELNGIEAYESASVVLGGVEATVVRTDFLKLPSYELIVPSGGVNTVREAVLAGEASLRLNPYNPDWYHSSLGTAHFFDGSYDKALDYLEPIPDVFCDTPGYLAATHAYLGNVETAAAYADTAEQHFRLKQIAYREYRDLSCLEWLTTLTPFLRAQEREHFTQGLVEAGIR